MILIIFVLSMLLISVYGVERLSTEPADYLGGFCLGCGIGTLVFTAWLLLTRA